MDTEVANTVLGFISNSWVISLAAGLIVYAITKSWEKFKDKKQYNQFVSLANKEVFNTLRQCIPEERLPNVYTLEAVHLSTSKQYGIKQEDMDTLIFIIFDLIKEVMDSNFLSYEDKIKYSDNLKILAESINANPPVSTPERSDEDSESKWFGGQIKGLNISLIFAVIASFFSYIISEDAQFLLNLFDFPSIDIISLFGLVALASTVITLITLIKLKGTNFNNYKH